MTKQIRVGIVGATGYTALEVARLLDQHPAAKIVAATSRAEVGSPLAKVHPSLTGRVDVQIESLDPAALVKKRSAMWRCAVCHMERQPKRCVGWWNMDCE